MLKRIHHDTFCQLPRSKAYAKSITFVDAVLLILQIKLEDAEQKKTVAEGIAENVSREKAIVEVETGKAQVQAEQVAKTQAEVSNLLPVQNVGFRTTKYKEYPKCSTPSIAMVPRILTMHRGRTRKLT